MKNPPALAILIFEDVEVLDFCGPFELFSVANRFTDPPAFNVLTRAEKTGPIRWSLVKDFDCTHIFFAIS